LEGRKILIGSAILINIKLYFNILNELVKNGFLEIFSNLTIALQILLTVLMLPMSVETIEASFSKLKIIELPKKYNNTDAI